MINAAPGLKKTIITLHIKQGHNVTNLSDEFGYPRGVISPWVREYQLNELNEEQHLKMISDAEQPRKLILENKELKKENDFLKKVAAFFAKESK